jgi:diguanylate cyclase (GGDEF)-like protein/PAS domain S-box-containing protein
MTLKTPSLEILFDHMDDGVYLLNPQTSHILWCNRAGYQTLGLNKDEVMNHSVLSLQKDVQGLPQWDEIRKVIESSNAYTFVGRHRHKEGGEVAVEVVTTHFEWQNTSYFLSVARNINKRLALEKDLQTRKHSVWFALNEASDGLWEWELATDYVFFSPQLKKMLGYGPEEMAPHVNTWINNVHPEDVERVTQILKEHLTGTRGNYKAEYRLRNRNGHYLWVLDKGKVCQRDPEGKPSHVVGMVQDITEQKQLQLQLELLASNDMLTGLPNRGEGEKKAVSKLIDAQTNASPACVVVIDFDDFKNINDLYGHQKGDEVLKYGSGLLRSALRDGDYIYRWGGEEFVLLLPATSLEQASDVLNNFHQAFKNADWQKHNIPPITLSAGVACYPEHGTEFEALLKQADTAVYQAKLQGRNRTVFSENSVA